MNVYLFTCKIPCVLSHNAALYDDTHVYTSLFVPYRESSRSNKGLMEYHNETRNGSFQKQSSIGNSSVLTISSQSSETGDFQETPNTATSIISNDQVFFTQNPAAAGSAVPPPKLVTSHPASVPVLPTQSSSTDYPQSNGRINHSGSATFGLTLNGSAFPIYPIPEHPNQSVGSHTFPNHTAHKNHHYPSSTVGELGSPQEQEFEMTENPLNASFEQEKVSWLVKITKASCQHIRLSV